jgi:hypothetical protein
MHAAVPVTMVDRVVGCHFVTTTATVVTPDGRAAVNILSRGNRFQMIWIHTRRVPAEVVKLEAVRDRAHMMLVEKSVSLMILSAMLDRAIAPFVRSAAVHPASGDFVNVVVEKDSIDGRFHPPFSTALHRTNNRLMRFMWRSLKRRAADGAVRPEGFSKPFEIPCSTSACRAAHRFTANADSTIWTRSGRLFAWHFDLLTRSRCHRAGRC